MQGILYEEPSAWLFLLVTVVLGGGAAWMTGRAISLTWRPFWQVLLWSVPLALAVRFLHFALFQGTFVTLQFYIVDLVVVLGIAALGFRYYRTRQMTRQYSWLYERSGPLSWREKTQP